MLAVLEGAATPLAVTPPRRRVSGLLGSPASGQCGFPARRALSPL